MGDKSMSVRNKILIIEDESSIRYFMEAILTLNGYETVTAATGKEGISMISSHCTDLGLPDMDGMEIVTKMREWTPMPVIVVSSRGEKMDKVTALEKGADDYISKPFGTAELFARIKVALRHAARHGSNPGITPEGRFAVGGLVVDFGKCRVTVDGRDAELTQNEYRIVALLAKYAGRVLTYEYIRQHRTITRYAFLRERKAFSGLHRLLFFRHLAQISLERRQPSCAQFIQSDEKITARFNDNNYAVLP